MTDDDNGSRVRSQRGIAACIAWEGALAGLGNPDAAARLLKRLECPVSWPDVIAESMRLRLAPLFHLGLHNFPILSPLVPVRMTEALRRAAHASAVRLTHLERACASVVARATAAGIRVLVLKGLALGVLVYPSPLVRPMDDVDLLVAETDRERLSAILREAGYRNDLRGEEDFFPPSMAYSVDLHTGLVNTTRIPARAALWSATFEDVWARSQTVTLADVPARTLGPLDTILHLAIHTVHHHGLSGGLWMTDLTACLRAWPLTVRDAMAAPLPVRRSLWHCLEFLRDRGQDPVPDVHAIIRPHRLFPGEKWMLAAIGRGDAPQAFRYAFTVACLPHCKDRMAFLRQLLFPDPSIYTKGFEDGGKRTPGWIDHWHAALQLGRSSLRSVLANRK